MNLESLKVQLIATVTQYGGKIILAIIAFVIGRFLISKLVSFMSNVMTQRSLDKDLKSFLTSLVNVLLNIMLLLSIAGIIGVQTSSFVAVLGAATLAVGLALQGSLANFAMHI